MSYIASNPREAWAQAFETGLRTQACADLEEAGAKVQTSGAKGGGSFNDHYAPVYSVIRRMEREQPVLAAVGHWLSLNDTGAANQYLDDVADTLLMRYIVATPGWAEYRKARKERVEALVQARLMQDRDNVDGSRPPMGPAAICAYTNGWLGVKIVEYNWQRDGWDMVWLKLGEILHDMESEAMTPIVEVAHKMNRLMRQDMQAA